MQIAATFAVLKLQLSKIPTTFGFVLYLPHPPPFGDAGSPVHHVSENMPPPPPPFGDSGSSYFLSTPRPQGDYDSSYIWRPKYRTSACFVATSNPPAQSHRKHKMRRERARFTDFNIKTCVSAFQSKTRIPLHVLVLVLWY